MKFAFRKALALKVLEKAHYGVLFQKKASKLQINFRKPRTLGERWFMIHSHKSHETSNQQKKGKLASRKHLILSKAL
ncbi:conserved domain protein [delta proteobacterium NaphS2]|nr:conserved domain protein [delta proteobacterium NaphS2]